jgi:hypothetical protein
MGGYDSGCFNCLHYANRSMPKDLMKFGVAPIRSVNRERYIDMPINYNNSIFACLQVHLVQRSVYRSNNVTAESELRSSYFNERFVLSYEVYRPSSYTV